MAGIERRTNAEKMAELAEAADGIEARTKLGEMRELRDCLPDGWSVETEGALALFFAVGTARRWRLEAEWLASKLAGFGHSPTRKDGRTLDCGHYFCRDGCAFCWLEAAEKAADRTMEQKPRRRAGRK